MERSGSSRTSDDDAKTFTAPTAARASRSEAFSRCCDDFFRRDTLQTKHFILLLTLNK